MVELITGTLTELRQNIRWADIFDIVLTSGLLFLLITWIRRDFPPRARRGLGIVLITFLGIYTVAEVMDIYLVSRIIEVLFLAFIIGTVVVFQADLRRIIDQMDSWNFLRDRPVSTSNEQVNDILTEALASLADRKIGALIALKGDEPWDRHLEGGINLKGEVSRPLLYSLFNPTSPAHDGALLIKENTVLKFGVHLPLSTRIPEDSDYGTRHAAALGLSERTDALILAVSEERGEITVAERGTLTTVESDGLKHRLEQFASRHAQSNVQQEVQHPGFKKLQTAALSFLAAVSLWLVFAYSPNLWYRTFEVPIVYQNLPEQWRIESTAPTAAQISISGAQRSFEAFSPENLTVVVDLEDPTEGTHRKELSADLVRLPVGLSVAALHPDEVEIDLQKLQSHRVPVEVQTTGKLPATLELSNILPQPDSVTILHIPTPEQSVDRLLTEPIRLDEITESTDVERSLIIPTDVQLSSQQESTVDIQVEVQ
jgi:uncharacterized protein (TIGR00159 family)